MAFAPTPAVRMRVMKNGTPHLASLMDLYI